MNTTSKKGSEYIELEKMKQHDEEEGVIARSDNLSHICEKHKPMKQLLLSGNMKMSDLIQANYALLTVLPRFGIHLGFGDRSVADVCRAQGVSLELFLMICSIYTFDDYLPDAERFEGIDVEDIVLYLHNSHRYYLEERIPEIWENLSSLEEGVSEETPSIRILDRFFNEYRREVEAHFAYEEQTVFPYIRGLVHDEHTEGYSIEQFEENHSNIEDTLEDLKNILIKYLPSDVSARRLNRALFNVFLLEDDLGRHTLIENKVLVPFVMQLEKSHGR